MSRVDSFVAGNGLPSRIAYRVFRFGLVTSLRVYTRLELHGAHNVPATGPFVLAPVHRSYVDTPIASCVTRRRMRFMGKDTLWENRASAWLLSSLGGFPVTRGTADREALTRCIAMLTAGEPVVLFPEGERKSGPVVQPLFDGAVYIALKAGVPIVPVGIGGSELVMPKGARVIYPRKVHVIVGAPIPAPISSSTRVPRSTVKAHSALLHAELQRLFDEAETLVIRSRHRR